MNDAAVSSSTSVDLTFVGQQELRNRLREALDSIEPTVEESSNFWQGFPNDVSAPHDRTLVVGDLAKVVRRFREVDTTGWTTSVRRRGLYFLVFVRTETDRRYSTLVDDLARASDMRINVCNNAADWPTVLRCLSAGVTSLQPDTLVEVRWLPGQDGLWLHFGDGFAGVLRWSSLGIDPAREGLTLESARVSETGSAIEIAAGDGESFEIDAATARAVLDSDFGRDLTDAARSYGETLGGRIRARRTAMGLKQSELADRVGFDQAVISRIERGRVRPRIDTLRRLARGLETTVADLVGEESQRAT